MTSTLAGPMKASGSIVSFIFTWWSGLLVPADLSVCWQVWPWPSNAMTIYPLQNLSPSSSTPTAWPYIIDYFQKMVCVWHHLLKTRRWCFCSPMNGLLLISCNPTNRICRRIVHTIQMKSIPISLFLNVVRRIPLISNWDNFYPLKSLCLLTERP